MDLREIFEAALAAEREKDWMREFERAQERDRQGIRIHKETEPVMDDAGRMVFESKKDACT